MSVTTQRIETILSSAYSNQNYLELVNELFDSIQIVNPNGFNKEFSNFSSHIEGSTHIGNYTAPDNKKLIIVAVRLKAQTYVESSRSKQRSYAKKLIENAGCDAAFIAFYTEGDPKWRLSFVRLDYEMKIENGRLKAAESLTPAKRYSYLVGEGEPCHTAIDRLRLFIDNHSYHPTMDEIEEAFSVEKVTDEFFQLYCEKFHQIREHLEKCEDFVIEAEQHNFTSAQFAKKLMGQIVFLYFLQKKGWLGVNAWPRKLNEKEYKNAFYARGAKSRELIPIVYRPIGDGIYGISGNGLDSLDDADEAVLASCVKGEPWGTGPHNFMRKLYEVSERRKANFYEDYLEPLFYEALNVNRGEQGYCATLHCRIPFLSGGLFEPIDGYEWQHNNFDLPNSLFSEQTNGNSRTGNGILDIFDRYNFTMSEDEPMEREVAIDPEMLGKVFENLLEVSDRKSKGAFYTPREIVHYMCQESLINYLTGAMNLPDADIRDFILYGDLMKDEDTSKDKRQGNREMYISESLFKVEVDGSVSVNRLHELDAALASVRVADPAVGSGAFPLGILNEIVRARQNITEYLLVEKKSQVKPSQEAFVSREMHTERSAYRLKYETVKNCIFAADIEPSAVDIAQLRLWLSLVIDDEITPDAQTPLDGHRNPLPLPNLECNILCGNSLIDEFHGIRLINDSVLLGNKEYQLQTNQDIYESTLNALMDAQDELFRCDNTDKKDELKNRIDGLRDIIIMNQLEGASENTISAYKGTKQMATKPYVLWQLDFARVFREKGGFDIIIGNPPYIRERDNKTIFSPVNNTAFGRKYHQGKMDYWYYFLHKAVDIVNYNGSITFITPRYWLNSAGASNLIQRIKDELSFRIIIDIGNLKVFDNVVGYHMIAQYNKTKHEMFCYKKLKNTLDDVGKMNDTDNVVIRYLSNSNVITDSYEIIFSTEETSNEITLGEIADVSQGIVEASDRVSKRLYEKFPRRDTFIGKGIFVLTADEINALELSDVERKILVPYLDGNDLGRYSLSKARNWLIYSDQANRQEIATNPSFLTLKLHLDNMSEYITSSNAPYGLHRPRKRYFFENPKIIMPSMFAKNNFTIDFDGNNYVGMSFSCIVMKSNDYLLEYLLAILNSSYALMWFNTFGKRRGAGVDIGVDKIRSFPIMPCDMDVQKEIARKVKLLIANYDENIKLDNEIDTTISEIYKHRGK